MYFTDITSSKISSDNFWNHEIHVLFISALCCLN